MKNLVISFVLAIVAGSALANPVAGIDSEVNTALLDRYGVAVMIEASSRSSIPASNKIYQLLVGKLQREMRKAEILVFNGVLPEVVSPDEFDRTKLMDKIRELDNPYLDSVLLIGATVNAGLDAQGADNEVDREEVLASDIRLQVTLQFVDATTGLAFAAIDESSTLPIGADCRDACVSSSVNRQVISMGRTLASKAIIAMQFDNDPDSIQMAAAR